MTVHVLSAYRVPRLTGIRSPVQRQIMLSGLLAGDVSGKGAHFFCEDCYLAERGKKGIGGVILIPFNKGFLVVPQMDVVELAFRGDFQSMARIVTAVGKAVVPLPDVVDIAMRIGEEVAESLKLELPTPFDENDTAERYFRTALNDKRTLCVPYVDIVAGSAETQDNLRHPGEVDFRGYAFEAEDQAGLRRSVYLKTPFIGTFAAAVLTQRWRQEFDAIVVSIVEQAVDIREFWDQVQGVLRDNGLLKQEEERKEIRLQDMEVAGTPPRFFLGPQSEAAPIAELLLKGRLEDAGYEQAHAIAAVFLYEDTSSHESVLPGGRVAWLAAITDKKLANEVLERMRPVVEEYRQALSTNRMMRHLYTRDYVEMLERAARGEYLGRIARQNPGPFY